MSNTLNLFDKKLLIVVMLVCLFNVISCKKKDKKYLFKIFNETSYTLNEVSFYMEEENFEFILPNDSTGVIEQICECRELLGPSGVNISIRSYSDSTSTFENTCGITIYRDKFSKSIVNNIYISLDQNRDTTVCPNDLFKISLD